MAADPYTEVITIVVIIVVLALLGVCLWVLFRKYIFGPSNTGPAEKQLVQYSPLEAKQETVSRRISRSITGDSKQGSFERRLSGTGSQATKQEVATYRDTASSGVEAAKMTAANRSETLDDSKAKACAPSETITHGGIRETKASSEEGLDQEARAKAFESQDADHPTQSQSTRMDPKTPGPDNQKPSMPAGDDTTKADVPPTTGASAAPGTGAQIENPPSQVSQDHSKSKESRRRKKPKTSNAAGSTGATPDGIKTSGISSVSSKRKNRPGHDSPFKTSTGVAPEPSTERGPPQEAKEKPVRPQRRPSAWFTGFSKSNRTRPYPILDETWFENASPTGSCGELGITQIASMPGNFLPESTVQDESLLSCNSPRPPASRTAGQRDFLRERPSPEDNSISQCAALPQ